MFVLSAFADEIDPNLYVQMKVLKEHNINYIEMRGVNGETIVSYSIRQIKEFKKQLDDCGFKISAIGSPIGKILITEDFELHLDLFKHTLDIAEILDTEYIRMFSFYIPKKEKPSKYRNDVLERWASFADIAKDTDIKLLHENEKGIYGDTPERCLDLVKSIGGENVRLIFDPANFVQCGVTTYPDAFNLLKPYIEYMHIKDALFSNHEVVPAGYGDGHIRDILSALKKGGYNGFLSIEPHLANFTGFEALEQGLGDTNLPEGGPKEFATAANALKRILQDI